MADLTESSAAPPQTATPRQLPFREDCWTEEATSTLVDAWGSRYLELKLGNLRQKDWQTVADAVNALHAHSKKTHRTDVQCKNRIDTLKKKYKVERSRVSDSNGTLASCWPFYSRLDLLIGSTVTPKTTLPIMPYRSPPTTIVLPQKRPAPPPPPSSAVDDSYFRRNYSAVAAAAAAAAEEEDDLESESEDQSEDLRSTEESGGRKSRDLAGMRRLARAIEGFGEIYERVEGEKQRQMIELEKQRMEFQKDLEVQRMQLFMDTQVQLEKIKQAKRSGSNDVYS